MYIHMYNTGLVPVAFAHYLYACVNIMYVNIYTLMMYILLYIIILH